MMVNGSGTPDRIIWSQSINVKPNTDYKFSTWVLSLLTGQLAKLQFQINGVDIGPIFNAPNQTNLWLKYEAPTWNSGTNTTATINVLNQNTSTGGNDFGLDDISLTACQDYVIGNVVNAGNDQVICSNEPIQLGENPVNNFTYSWNNSTGLSSISEANPTLAISNTGSEPIVEEYILTIDSAGVGCIQTDTVFITILPVPDLWLGQPSILRPRRNCKRRVAFYFFNGGISFRSVDSGSGK